MPELLQLHRLIFNTHQLHRPCKPEGLNSPSKKCRQLETTHFLHGKTKVRLSEASDSASRRIPKLI